MDFDKLPNYHQLPIQPGAPAGASWGVFGENDELGCLNFLTPQGVVDAARLVQSGRVFRLDAKIGFAKPPLFGRSAVTHRIHPLGPFANDDVLDNYNTQESSQWDGLAHVGHIKHERFYGGVKPCEIKAGPGGRLSIHHWSDKFAGRGVLIDAYGYRKSRGTPVDPLSPDTYTLEELKVVLTTQGTTLKPVPSYWCAQAGWKRTKTPRRSGSKRSTSLKT